MKENGDCQGVRWGFSCVCYSKVFHSSLISSRSGEVKREKGTMKIKVELSVPSGRKFTISALVSHVLNNSKGIRHPMRLGWDYMG